MKLVTYALVSLTAIAGSVATLEAQTCLGLPASSVSSRNISLTAAFPERVTLFSARVGGIMSSGGFGGLSVAYESYDDADDASAFGFAADVGKEFVLATGSAVRVCPTASAQLAFGPDFDLGLGDDVSVTRFGGNVGGAIGTVIAASPGFSLIPYAQLSLAHLRLRVSAGEFTETDSQTGGILTAGVGLGFNDRVIVQPFLTKGFGFEGDTDVYFGVGVSFPVGRR